MPVPPGELYDRHAAEFAADTGLEELPEEFTALLESFVDAVPRPDVSDPDVPRPDVPGPDVLDAGCGPGRDVEYFHGRGLEPVGVDVAAGMLEHARANRPGRYARMDVRRLGFDDDRFDGVWCPATIFFLPPEGMATALREFARVLRPEGVARIGFKLGNGPFEAEKWGETTVEYHVPEERARTLLEAAGFRIDSASVNELSPERTFANFDCRLAP